jgi:hypothetical protein
MNQSPDREGRQGDRDADSRERERERKREGAGQTFAELDDNIEPLDLPD